MGTNNDFDATTPLDPQTEALRSMIQTLLVEQLQPIREQLSRLEADERERYVDLRARLARMQDGLDVLNNKFDAQADEVKYLRKSVRILEDRIDPVPVTA